jgi:hypothetical protein
MANCELCGGKKYERNPYCIRCQVTMFQLMEILELYIKSDSPPKWLIDGVRELSWIFSSYPRTAAYFNTAVELLWDFLLEGDEVNIDHLEEVNYTELPRDKIISFLEDALMIERNESILKPGRLVRKLQEIRWEGYQLDSEEMEKKLMEIHGILSVALTRSLIVSKDYLPNRSLAIFHVFSSKIISYEDQEEDQDEHTISDYIFQSAFSKLSKRQQDHLIRTMGGFMDGKTKIISDYLEEENSAILKETIISYISNMRERWRERELERERSS